MCELGFLVLIVSFLDIFDSLLIIVLVIFIREVLVNVLLLIVLVVVVLIDLVIEWNRVFLLARHLKLQIQIQPFI